MECTQGRKGRQPAAAKILEKSHFHGKEERNPVTGRSWMDPPKDKKKENEYCYLPKKWVHTWSGHTKGVNAIRFFPGTGELLHSWIRHFPSRLVKRLAASVHILRLVLRWPPFSLLSLLPHTRLCTLLVQVTLAPLGRASYLITFGVSRPCDAILYAGCVLIVPGYAAA